MVLAGIAPLVSALYMLGGRLLFTRVFAALLGLVGGLIRYSGAFNGPIDGVVAVAVVTCIGGLRGG